MTPAPEPLHRFRRRLALQVAGCWLLAVLAGIWAWRVSPPDAPDPPPLRPTATRTPAAAPAGADGWNVELWRPFGDAPAPAAAAPQAIKLFSILQRDDGLVAVLATADGLVYAKAGDDCKGFAVVRVETGAATLRRDGQELRLELRP